jgi:hypothetical protein
MRKCFICGKPLKQEDTYIYVADFDELEIEFVHGECIDEEEEN